MRSDYRPRAERRGGLIAINDAIAATVLPLPLQPEVEP